ncbi:SxtJ family membrane protein [Candidatus Neomarinimicrobiota bacterium]
MSKNTLMNYFQKIISKNQASDTGLALVLILLLIGLFTQNNLYYKIAIPVLIINMIFPMFYYPFAVIWLGFSQLLGTVVSKIILTIVYFVILLPIGIFRRLLGKDSLQLSEFKKGTGTVMKSRDYNYSSNDIEKPY